MAERIQLRRQRGWRKPEGAVLVTRPTKWGNPFTFDEPLDFLHVLRFAGDKGSRSQKQWRRDACVEAYRFVMTADRREVPPEEAAKLSEWDRATMVLRVGVLPTREEIIAELRGKDLCCWCALDACCHADVLLEIANA